MFSIKKSNGGAGRTGAVNRNAAVLTTHGEKKGAGNDFEMTANLRPTNQTSMGVGNLPVSLDLNPTLSGFMFNREEKHLVDIYKDIYYYDVVAGTAADLLSFLPFSDFSLRGLTAKQEKPFLESLERLNIHTLLPEISVDYLVFGTFIGSLVFNQQKKVFVDIIPQNFKHCTIRDFPFYGVDPIINVNMPKEVVAILKEDNSRVQHIRANYGSALIDRLSEGQIELEPLSTLYLPRRTMTCAEGTSYFRRILPIYFMEKNVYRGTLAESIKRLRSILHITAGDLDWEPSPEDLKFISELFINADNDPIGAIVATRNGVSTSEIRCLSGDTRIHTSKGLMKIKDMVSHDPEVLADGTAFETNLKVKGVDGEYHDVDQWWYQGYKRTYEVKTQSGISIKGTENHKLITIENGGYKALPFGKIKPAQTWALIDTIGNVMGSDKLPKFTDTTIQRKDNNFLEFPPKLTDDLGYAIGLIISEGYINSSGTVSATNTNPEIIKRYCAAISNSFNVNPTLRKFGVGERMIDGVTYATKAGTHAEVYSKGIVSYLGSLGIKPSAELRTDKSPSYSKTIPECIYRASRSVQLAFIAAYLDGDGCIGRGSKYMEFNFYSTSQEILNGLKLILANLGYSSNLDVSQNRITLTAGESTALKRELDSVKRRSELEEHVAHNKFGIPAEIVTEVILKRQTRVERNVDGVRGKVRYYFLNDDGEEVAVDTPWKTSFRHFMKQASPKYPDARSYFSYAKLEAGDYDEHLAFIEQVSAKLAKTMRILSCRKPKFEKVVSVTNGRKEHVYDLTMSSSTAPVFVANGLLVKNSGGDFWKVEDLWNSTIPAKLKALNLSEAFINGEASVQTLEASMSGFVEQLRSYRGMLTRKIFYDKLFPLISLTNEFYINDEAKAKAQEISKRSRNVDLANLMYQIQDTSPLVIPQVLWEKHLKPEGDNNYLEILKAMTEAGVPVPIRTMAAAGGVKLEQVLKEQEDDLATRKRVAAYQKRIADLLPNKPAGGDDFEGYASALAAAYHNLPTEHRKALLEDMPSKSMLHQKSGKPNMFSRNSVHNEEFEVTARTRTGKAKHIIGQSRANDAINERIAKAAGNLTRANKTL